MSKESIELNEAGQDVLSTLTAREAEVLRQRTVLT
jgi:DNA-directed RNA polymerase sigma subunit (sigma70/sigma32)